jgi:predicted nuclease of predicted toxin-antitoxin system
MIDFESVQPDALAELNRDPFKVIVFLGDAQSKVPLWFVSALQPLGTRAEYIQVAGNGPNALDFHIAFYMGNLAAVDPEARFHIVSKDKGFEPLINHLSTKKILALRCEEVRNITMVKVPNAKTLQQKLEIVIATLANPKCTKPGNMKTLSNAIACYLHKQVTEEEIAALIRELVTKNIVVVTEGKVTYPTIPALEPFTICKTG